MDHISFLREAYKTASLYSTDPSTQNGAILVNSSGLILASAANRFPTRVRDLRERWERPIKYSFVEHAERNVIYKAARLGIATVGLTMYCPWFACTDCARAIIQSGIAEVIGHDFDLHHNTSLQWKETIKIADTMLTEAGVLFHRIPGKVGGVRIRFNGELVEP